MEWYPATILLAAPELKRSRIVVEVRDFEPAVSSEACEALGSVEIEMAWRSLGDAFVLELQAMKERQHRGKGMDGPDRRHVAHGQDARRPQYRGEMVGLDGGWQGVRCHAGSAYTAVNEGETSERVMDAAKHIGELLAAAHEHLQERVFEILGREANAQVIFLRRLIRDANTRPGNTFLQDY